MLGTHKLILDTFCEVYDLLEHWSDDEFWNFNEHDIVPGAIYLVSRKEVLANVEKVRHIAETGLATIVFSNPAEGSETFVGQCRPVKDFVLQKKILLIGGGDMESQYPCLQYDSFLPKLFDYSENLQASEHIDDIFTATSKPYKFLFLNGRVRPQRKYLLERFQLNGLLDQAIWTNLETGSAQNRIISLYNGTEDLMLRPMPVHLLDPKYEVDRYRNYENLPLDQYPYSKNTLFNHEWGEVYLTPEPYLDSYFSLVTETVFNYPYSFRTEKIWKPIAMGHPWIAVANCGYYRDMRNLGFQTFGHVIDESFDTIENSQQRIERIAQVVEDLCRQDLAKFLEACYNVCKYNQQHLAHMRLQVRKEFPDRFAQFINQHFNERPSI